MKHVFRVLLQGSGKVRAAPVGAHRTFCHHHADLPSGHPLSQPLRLSLHQLSFSGSSALYLESVWRLLVAQWMLYRRSLAR